MFNRTPRLAAAMALSACVSTLGSPALAWSALQYDTQHETDQGIPKRTIYEELMEKERRGAQKAEDEGGAASPTDEAGAAERAQNAIEKDASLDLPDEKTAPSSHLKESLDDEQATPLPAAQKPKPGKQPTESIDDPTYFYKKARVFAQEGDFQSALNYVNQALILHPQYWEASYEKALIYQLSGYDAAAARRYIALLEHKPDMLAPRLALAMLYRKHGNMSLAESEYQKAIETNFRWFPAHYNLANLYMQQKKMDLALKEYQLCLKLQPENAQVHNNIGVIYQHRNYMEEAVAEFTKATHFEPGSQAFADNLANAKAKIGHKAKKEVAM